MENNLKDILKKILLNMKYDPKKTLKENNTSLKKILTEGCVPLDTKLETYSDSENGSKGKPKSLIYSELGTWGDGTCRCKKNNKCLEFKKSCCTGKGIGVVSVGGLEQERFKDEPTTTETPTETPTTEIKYVQYVGCLGIALVVPEKTKILNWGITRESLEAATIEKYAEWSPGLKNGCEKTRSNDVIKCLKDFKDKEISVTPQEKYVHSFQLPNGKKYKSCYTIYKGDSRFVPFENQTFFSEYNTSCEPLGIKYESPNQKIVTKKSEDVANSISPTTGKEILNKRLKGTNTYINDPGSYDNEGSMLFQLGSGSE